MPLVFCVGGDQERLAVAEATGGGVPGGGVTGGGVTGGGDGVPAGCTAIENGGNTAFVQPSYAVIVMLGYVPALAAAGVPESRPVAPSKAAPQPTTSA